jgi:scyllo-inositol 2-dehydrogenase (NADP+)
MTTPSTSDTINVGLIGFGLAGRAFHAPVISAVPGLRLAAILQRTGSDAAQAYPNARIVRTLDEFLALPEIRLIVIATPNQTHYPLAHQCLAAGLLTVYQSRRYDGDFQGILQLAAAGTLGHIVRFETHYDRFRPNLKPNAWRERQVPGAGILFDIGPHLIDHALQLFGLPMAMTADVRNERGGPADDAFDLLLHYPGNVRAALGSSILAAAPRTRFVALGDKAAFTKNSFDPQEIRLRFGNIPKEGPWGAEPEVNWGVLTQITADGTPVHRRIPPAATDYRDYYANLRDALQGRAEPAVTHRQMLEIMQALELARQSSNQRRTLDWPRDLQPRS